ncbi:unnamed protein product [Phaedon cochleariae]|uniref:RING-type domain-containing protein n=1 Tax=Phaedon cochleariae TaxID=80249 RepID=A0A9P0DNZ2_PHACE|nr:unnamed protein product [Phaedon cochleariae]
MTDWLHCNKCSAKYQPNIKLYLTECAHIFCEKCREVINDPIKCPVCDKPNNFIPISKDMDANVQQFFIPFEVQVKKLSEMYNFQMQHRMRLFQTMSQKYAFLKKEFINVHNKGKNLARENTMLKNMLMSTSRNSQPFQTSTPALTNDDSSHIDEMSVVSSIPFTPSIVSSSARKFPGHPQRVHPSFRGVFPVPGSCGGGIFHRPSPAQMVPSGGGSSGGRGGGAGGRGGRRAHAAPVHRPVGTAFSLQQLQGGGDGSMKQWK